MAANWNESELDNKIKDVQSTPDVKTVKITKKSRAVARALPPENVLISDNVTIKKIPWPITRRGVMILIIVAVGSIIIDSLIFPFYGAEAVVWGMVGIEFTIGVGFLIFAIQMKVEQNIQNPENRYIHHFDIVLLSLLISLVCYNNYLGLYKFPELYPSTFEYHFICRLLLSCIL